MNPSEILEAVNEIMPFGKYSGRRLLQIPDHYLVWLQNNAMPKGKLGTQLALVYEVKLNGLEALFIYHNGKFCLKP